ncbi:ribonuclease H-like YkuK family protein [Candidatus Parcubacteria bacterium]|nr:ribonuclease H-like YkuK family protein [Patescibacteria group bacterium]MBU4466958.1 ribonuclease H-like YkuK family protein [Patescibacteria group bacterium]MCG2688228.1 ribonuclease H-like YkuK family protein [Candidatus Parcubacteria bacterium]
MASSSEKDFYNPSKGHLSFNEMIDELLEYIQQDPEVFYDVIVGCDSASSDFPEFPLVVVALKTGFGGRFFLKKVSYQNKKFYHWKTRILEEVYLSCELALNLREALEEKIIGLETIPNYQFRYIHADVGENGQTKEMVKEVAGIIRGNGFELKIKPEAFAASNVADHFS